MEGDIVAGDSEDMGDAVAHLAGANHANALDLHTSLAVFGMATP